MRREPGASRRALAQPASFIVPSGNLGNVTACVWARRLGAPIADIVLAHNANRTVPDFLEHGVLRTRPSVATLASAMDVGSPSNLERLTAMYPDVAALRAAVSAVSIDDEAIRARIRADHERYGVIWCPHTATAAEAWARLDAQQRHAGHWILVATAHPAKFREIVEPLIGRPVPVPESLVRLFRRPAHSLKLTPQCRHCARPWRGEYDMIDLSQIGRELQNLEPRTIAYAAAPCRGGNRNRSRRGAHRRHASAVCRGKQHWNSIT